MIKKLIDLANKLDLNGLTKEADTLDYIILKLAMSVQDASSILGIPINATKEEIQKAWKRKVFDAHPDRGGDIEDVKKINVARDVMMGGMSGESSWAPHASPPNKQTYREYEKPERVRVSWEDASKEAGVPKNINWIIITQPSHSPILGDRSASGYVVIGKDEDSGQYVFVGVYRYKENNYFAGSDVEKYKMWVSRESGDLSKIANRAIEGLWKNFEYVKGFSKKAAVLPKGTVFDESLQYFSGRTTSLKNAIELVGEGTIKTTGKVDIVMELERGKSFDVYSITFAVNGYPFELSDEMSAKLSKQSNLLRAIFGGYYYSGSKKSITRMRKNKKSVLEYLVKKLDGNVSNDLIDALNKALEQTK